MNREDDVQQKQLRNYRLMFRFALLFLAISLIVTLFGGFEAVVESEVEWFVYGLLMLAIGMGSAYLTVDATVRILEDETHGVRPRSE